MFMVSTMVLPYWSQELLQRRIPRLIQSRLHQRDGMFSSHDILPVSVPVLRLVTGLSHQTPLGQLRVLGMEVSSNLHKFKLNGDTNWMEATDPIPVYTPAPLWKPGGEYDKHYWGSF